jgi:hypothetical protein
MTNPKDIRRKGKSTLYHGYCGDIIINKFFDGATLYGITNPIITKDVNIYAFKHRGIWLFCTNMFQENYHCLRIIRINGTEYNIICTGEFEYDRHCSREEAIKLCKVVFGNLSLMTSRFYFIIYIIKNQYGLKRLL